MVIALILLFMMNIFLYTWKEITIDLNSAVFGLGIFVLILSWTFLTFLHLEMLYTTKKRQIMDWLD